MRFEAKVKGKLPIQEHERILVREEQVRGADYSNLKLRQFTSVGSSFFSCSFRDITIQDAQFAGGGKQSTFDDCVFDGARIERLSGNRSRFQRCSFLNVRIEGWIASEVELVDCVFSGELKRVVFFGQVPPGIGAAKGKNEFQRNDFSRANFIDVGFRNGINLSSQKLPTGPDYLYLPDAESRIKTLLDQLSGWQLNLEVRERALVLARGLQREVGGGQQQLLLKRSEFYQTPNMPKEAVDLFFSLLEP
jgi:hypothetical protein